MTPLLFSNRYLIHLFYRSQSSTFLVFLKFVWVMLIEDNCRESLSNLNNVHQTLFTFNKVNIFLKKIMPISIKLLRDKSYALEILICSLKIENHTQIKN